MVSVPKAPSPQFSSQEQTPIQVRGVHVSLWRHVEVPGGCAASHTSRPQPLQGCLGMAFLGARGLSCQSVPCQSSERPGPQLVASRTCGSQAGPRAGRRRRGNEERDPEATRRGLEEERGLATWSDAERLGQDRGQIVGFVALGTAEPSVPVPLTPAVSGLTSQGLASGAAAASCHFCIESPPSRLEPPVCSSIFPI